MLLRVDGRNSDSSKGPDDFFPVFCSVKFFKFVHAQV